MELKDYQQEAVNQLVSLTKKYLKGGAVSFVYTPKERKALEEDSSSMNGVPCVKARALLPDYDEAKAEVLQTTGVNPHDIIQMLVYHGTKPQNTFYSQERCRQRWCG